MSVLSLKIHGPVAVFTVIPAKLDASLVPDFKREFTELAQPMPKDLVLDLGAVRFVDSSALGALVSVYKAAAGGRVRLLGVTAPVLGLLKLTRMDRVFEIIDNLAPEAA